MIDAQLAHWLAQAFMIATLFLLPSSTGFFVHKALADDKEWLFNVSVVLGIAACVEIAAVVYYLV